MKVHYFVCNGSTIIETCDTEREAYLACARWFRAFPDCVFTVQVQS
jgi:hypothetical protein